MWDKRRTADIMSDARYPERWLTDRRVLRLTDRGYRSFVQALAWSVSNRTDGYLEPEDLPLIPGFTLGTDDELVASGLWLENGRGWRIEPFDTTQTSSFEHIALEKARHCNRERQAKFKAKRAAEERDNVTDNVSNNVTSSVTTQARQGKDSLRSSLHSHGELSAEVIDPSSSKAQSLRKSGTAPRARGSRLPDSWQPPDDVIRAMRDECPHVDLRREHAKFCDYWRAKAGANATKLDWVATWRNWIRRAGEQTPQINGHRVGRADQKGMDWMALGRQDQQKPQKGLPQ